MPPFNLGLAGGGRRGVALDGWGAAAGGDFDGDHFAFVDHAGFAFHVLVVGRRAGLGEAGFGDHAADDFFAWFRAGVLVEDLLGQGCFRAFDVGDFGGAGRFGASVDGLDGASSGDGFFVGVGVVAGSCSHDALLMRLSLN